MTLNYVYFCLQFLLYFASFSFCLGVPTDNLLLLIVGSKVRGQNVPLIPTSMGQGQDYFDEMFRDLTRETLYTAPPSPPPQKQQRSKSSMDKYQSSVYHDYNTATSR